MSDPKGEQLWASFPKAQLTFNTRFSMNRRDMMKLVSLVMLPMVPEVAMAGSAGKTPPLR
jgi:hypothetical protein